MEIIKLLSAIFGIWAAWYVSKRWRYYQQLVISWQQEKEVEEAKKQAEDDSLEFSDDVGKGRDV